MMGAITSRHACEVEAGDLVIWRPDNEIAHHGDVTASTAAGRNRRLTVACSDCHSPHAWEIAANQLVTVQRTPR